MKQEKHEIRCSEIEKRLGKCRFFEKSYKNTRTKIQGIPYGMPWILFTPKGLEQLNATVRWTVAKRRLDGVCSIVSRVPSGVPLRCKTAPIKRTRKGGGPVPSGQTPVYAAFAPGGHCVLAAICAFLPFSLRKILAKIGKYVLTFWPIGLIISIEEIRAEALRSYGGFVRRRAEQGNGEKPRMDQYRVRLEVCPSVKAGHWGNLRRQGRFSVRRESGDLLFVRMLLRMVTAMFTLFGEHAVTFFAWFSGKIKSISVSVAGRRA